MWLFKHVAKTQTETSPVQYRVLWLKFQPGSLFEQLNMKRIGVTFPGEQSWPPGSLGLHFCWTIYMVELAEHYVTGCCTATTTATALTSIKQRVR